MNNAITSHDFSVPPPAVSTQSPPPVVGDIVDTGDILDPQDSIVVEPVDEVDPEQPQP